MSDRRSFSILSAADRQLPPRIMQTYVRFPTATSGNLFFGPRRNRDMGEEDWTRFEDAVSR